jgi:hypothetical protein
MWQKSQCYRAGQIDDLVTVLEIIAQVIYYYACQLLCMTRGRKKGDQQKKYY